MLNYQRVTIVTTVEQSMVLLIPVDMVMGHGTLMYSNGTVEIPNK